jgi:hypothetical protein
MKYYTGALGQVNFPLSRFMNGVAAALFQRIFLIAFVFLSVSYFNH